VTLVFTGPVDAAGFAALPGVSDVQAYENTLWMRVADGIDAVVKLAARYTLVDMRVEHPSLDEVFLGYYESHAGAAPPARPGGPS
jgi:ABC-2 type transport system ATP-binding protein